MMRRPVERKRCLTMFNAMIGKLGVSELLIILLIVPCIAVLTVYFQLEPDGPKDSKHEGSSKKEDSAE